MTKKSNSTGHRLEVQISTCLLKCRVGCGKGKRHSFLLAETLRNWQIPYERFCNFREKVVMFKEWRARAYSFRDGTCEEMVFVMVLRGRIA